VPSGIDVILNVRPIAAAAAAHRFAWVPLWPHRITTAPGSAQYLLPADLAVLRRRPAAALHQHRIRRQALRLLPAEIGPRVRSGEIHYREDIVDGLEKAPEAFIGMLAGRNFGSPFVMRAPAFDGGAVAEKVG
jgi:hypothetical protein